MNFLAKTAVDRADSGIKDEGACLLWHLLSFTQADYFAMMYAYLDESGTHSSAPVMCVAGVMYTESALIRLDRAWKGELNRAGITHFHTTDYSSLQGEFRGMDKTHADQLYRNLLALVTKHFAGTAAVYIYANDKQSLFPRRQRGFGPYSACTYVCMEKLKQLAEREFGKKQISFSIEKWPQGASELLTLLEKREAIDGWPGVTYALHRKGLRPLETADILAYEYARRLRERGKGELRESLRTLLLLDQPNTYCHKYAKLIHPMVQLVQEVWNVKLKKKRKRKLP
jgi:hypothetical protein